MSGTLQDYILVVGIFNGYMVLSLGLFLLNRDVDFIRKRQPLIVALHTFVAMGIGNDYIGIRQWASYSWISAAGEFGIYVINYLMGPLWMFFYFVRCIGLVTEYYSNIIHVSKSKVKHLNFVEKAMFRVIRLLGAAPVNAKTRIVSTTEAELINKAEGQENTIATIQPKSIFKVIAWVVALETLVLFAVLGYTGCFTNGNGKCDNQSGDGYLPLYAFVLIFFLSIPWFSYLIRKVRDSFYIRLEFQCALSAFFIFFLLYVLDEYTDALQSISPGPTFWMWLAVVITHTICVTIPAGYAFYYKYLQKSILVDNTMEAFNKVLMDHRLFASFKKTLAEDFSIENGLFWDDWLSLQPTDEKKTVDIPKTVLHMYETYIQVGAKYELNISSTCRKKIYKEIAEKNYKPEILEAAKNEVFQMMYLNSFPRFVMKVKNGANNSTVNTSKNQTTTGKQSAIDGSIIA